MTIEATQGLALCYHVSAMATSVGTFLFAVARHIIIHNSPITANLDENIVLLITRMANLLLTTAELQLT